MHTSVERTKDSDYERNSGWPASLINKYSYEAHIQEWFANYKHRSHSNKEYDLPVIEKKSTNNIITMKATSNANGVKTDVTMLLARWQ